MQMREKVGKSRNTVLFQWFVAPEGRKVGSLKPRVRSHLARWEMKNCTPLWREANFAVKMYKTHHSRTTFGSWDVEKVHAGVARSTFRCQQAQKHKVLGLLLDVQMLFRVAGARDCGPCQKVSKTWRFCSIFTYNHHYTTLHSNTPHYNYNHTFATFHYTTLHYTPLIYTQLHSITLHYTPIHYNYTFTTFHYTTLHSITLNYTTLHSITLHYTTLHYTPLHYIPLHYATLNDTALQLQLQL